MTEPDLEQPQDPQQPQLEAEVPLARLLPFLFATVAFALVSFTIADPGLTYDEPTYISASYSYLDWLGSPSFSAEKSDAIWKMNHEHPPFAKLFMGLVRRFVHGLMPGYPEIAASRLASAIMFAILVGLVFQWAASCEQEPGRKLIAGGAAAAFAMLTPRLFAHAHFAALDMPMAALWLATAYAFAKGLSRRPWAVAAGVLFGLALLTKINAVFIPLPLIVWAIFTHPRKMIVPTVMMLVIGTVVFFVGWPWLWHSTFPRLDAYLFGTSLDRAVVPVYYFGTVYAHSYAPWHYPLVLTLLTLPLGILLCLLVGTARSLKWRKNATSVTPMFAVFNLAAILLTAMIPQAPKYDGVRLFLPLFPFAAILAGLGFAKIWRWWGEKPYRVAAASLFFALQAVGVLWYHPYQTSYYSLLCGGLPGAAELGLETTYWCDTYGYQLQQELAALPQGSRVAFYPEVLFANKVYPGLLPENITYADFNSGNFDYAVLANRQGYLLQKNSKSQQAETLFNSRPKFEISRFGVPLCRIVPNTQNIKLNGQENDK